MVVEEKNCFGFSFVQEVLSQEFEVVHGFFVISEFEKGGDGDFVLSFFDVDADVNLVFDEVFDEVSDFLFGFFHDFVIFFFTVSSVKVGDVDAAL